MNLAFYSKETEHAHKGGEAPPFLKLGVDLGNPRHQIYGREGQSASARTKLN